MSDKVFLESLLNGSAQLANRKPRPRQKHMMVEHWCAWQRFEQMAENVWVFLE